MAPPTESTPLIQVVSVRPPRDRYPHTALRRFCTLLLLVTLIVIVILFLIPIKWLPHPKHDPWHHHHPWENSSSPGHHEISRKGISNEKLRQILLDTPKEEKAREWSKYYTSGPHLAGKNLSQAEWTRDRWQEFGIEQPEVVAYDVYINYPLGHRLALLEATSSSDNPAQETSYAVKREFNLEEDVLEEDPTTGLEDRIPTFHGYSASGNVTGQYVFVNYGTYRDYEDLVNANVSLSGKIAVAKYGKIFRGLKIKRAEELGMIGAVLYTDPEEDGEITEQNGYEAYPNGPARNPSAVQRGSVQFISSLPGDPTTPGYPSLPGAPRQETTSIPKIPSLPISYQEAIPLLKALNGYGPSAKDFDERWQGGKLGYKGVEYSIGPSPPELVLNLVNEVEYVINPLWNVIGIINGTIEDEIVVLGNHRDAWIAGGAGDPNSGSATMNEVIRSFGAALAAGWKPLRTIVFASWDGEEYGLVGSTEWVEQYIPWLKDTAVAYFNLDVSTRGSYFQTSASPLLNRDLYEITSLVQSPNQTIKGQTIADLWDGTIHTMGSGSDFTAFQDFAGIPSLDMGFGGGPGDPVYHYHSNYDSFHWMSSLCDPHFSYHVAAAKILSLLAANIVQSPVIALNTTDYARALSTYVDNVKKRDDGTLRAEVSASPALFKNIERAISDLLSATIAFDAKAADLANGWAKDDHPFKKSHLLRQIKRVNTKYKYFERQFLYLDGLDSRPWFKHVVFAPGKWTGYAGATFPGLVEALDEGDSVAAKKWSAIIEANIRQAQQWLQQ